MWFNLAWRLFRHEARRGELTIILLAIILSVGSVLSLSLFSERLQSAINEQAAEFLASDAILDSNYPIESEWLDKSSEMGLEHAYIVWSRSMVFGNDNLILGDIRAVTKEYPLKGEIRVDDKPFTHGEVTTDIPAPGEIWLESPMLQQLGVKVGDAIEVGDKVFTLTKVLSHIPDGGFSVFAVNPKVLINLEDLEATNIIGPGSRSVHVYFFIGEESQIEAYYDWLEPKMDREIHDWSTVFDSDGGFLGNSVDRAEQYFLLASLLAIVLASVAIAVAAQRYSQRHYDPVAIMKTLGASKQTVQRVYLLQILFVTVVGIVIGGAVGFGIQHAVVMAIQDKISVGIQTWYWGPVWISIFTGVVCAVLFSVYPLLKLFSVPPLRVLRKDLGAKLSSRFIQFLAAGSAILMLMWAYSQNIVMSLILFSSGIVLVIALLFVTYGLIWLGRKLGQGRMGAWQLAWARIQRRAMDNSVQLISFSVTIMLLLVVLVMRNDMVQQWRDQLPEGTPNYFLINISHSELPRLEKRFEEYNVHVDEYWPVMRGRFVAVNDERVSTSVAKSDEEEETRTGLGREANLTWSLTLQNQNEIVEGEWLTEWHPGEPYPVSVEQRSAERMNIKMGDVLSFNIGSVVVNATVTSIRTVNWQTMQPNFYFILHPDAMKDFLPTYISSFNLPEERKSIVPQLMAPFGTVSLIDVDARINQVRKVIDQVSVAVEFILILVLIAGSLVLVAQVQSSMDERQQELAILRTLGAKGLLIRLSVIFEFIIIGVVAGFMAALANELTLYLLQSQVFKMNVTFHFEYWLIAPLIGAGIVGLLGGLSCWRLLSLNTSKLLRQMV